MSKLIKLRAQQSGGRFVWFVDPDFDFDALDFTAILIIVLL